MSRVDGWSDHLFEVIERHGVSEYRPGSFDCFSMACDVVHALTGERVYPDVKYTTDAGAIRAMTKRGFPRLGDAMAAVLSERPAGHAQRGDIAVIETGSGALDTLGIIMGETVLVRVGNAMTQQPLSAARLILAVG